MSPELRTALLLLLATKTIIKKRKYWEHHCGYSEDYGGDKLLLQQIGVYLESPAVKKDADILRKEFTR